MTDTPIQPHNCFGLVFIHNNATMQMERRCMTCGRILASITDELASIPEAYEAFMQKQVPYIHKMIEEQQEQ